MTQKNSEPCPLFENWRVVVSGGSRGIGAAIATGFADRGAQVAVCARSEASLNAIRETLSNSERYCYVASCDVSDGNAVRQFVPTAAREIGGVDVVVNCASAFSTSDDETGWLNSINVDLMGTVRMGWAALPFLRQSDNPSIINVSSIAAFQATSGRLPYGAAKAAVVHQTASNAKLLAEHRVRVNCVLPGSTEFAGGIWDKIGTNQPDLYERTRRSIPMQRFATPDDIARVVFFLASPAAAWITGQSIAVDGGQTLFGS